MEDIDQIRKKSVLVVEESESMRFLISEALKPLGHTIDTAKNTETALQKIAEKDYSLIITDYSTPESSGLELTRTINKFDPSLPVLAFADEGLCEEFLESGALACLKKPFSIPEIQILSQVILSDSLSPSSYAYSIGQ